MGRTAVEMANEPPCQPAFPACFPKCKSQETPPGGEETRDALSLVGVREKELQRPHHFQGAITVSY